MRAPVIDMKHRRWCEDVIRRRRDLVFVAGAAALPGTGCTQAAAVRAAGSWGRAITVPGLGALNKGRNAGVSSASCPSAGSCAAVGLYRDGGRHQQGFVSAPAAEQWLPR